jgi:hypothetical protein
MIFYLKLELRDLKMLTTPNPQKLESILSTNAKIKIHLINIEIRWIYIIVNIALQHQLDHFQSYPNIFE